MMVIYFHAHIDAQCTSDLQESQVVRSGMKQVNVALPDEIRGYLEEIAAKNGRKLSEEVRARLDQSVVDDRFDATTKELGRDVMWLAELQRGKTGGNTFTTQRAHLESWRVPAGDEL